MIGRAQTLFKALQDGPVFLCSWVVQTCIKKIIKRIEYVDYPTTSKDILCHMKDYEHGEEDARFFAENWPNGMSITYHGRIYDLQQWLVRIEGLASSKPAKATYGTITSNDIRTWVSGIGQLKERTLERLRNLDTYIETNGFIQLLPGGFSPVPSALAYAISAYLAWCGVATLLKDKDFTRFLCGSSILRGITSA